MRLALSMTSVSKASRSTSKWRRGANASRRGGSNRHGLGTADRRAEPWKSESRFGLKRVRIAGITGGGEYHVVIVSDTALWDELRGEYKIATAASGSSTPPTTGGLSSNK